MTVGTGVISGSSVAHERASLDELELAAAESEAAAVERLLSVPAVDEAFVIQTCNRTEAYVVTPDEADGRAALAALYEDTPDDVVRELDHEESLRHLMRVASGLESIVLGEDQILGQMKSAFATAREAGGIGPIFEEGISKAIHVGERARAETEINEGAVSIASAAVKLALNNVSAEDPTAVVVGAGEMGRLAAKNLAPETDHLYVANRTPAKAEHIVSTVEGATAVELDDTPSLVAEAAILVTATGSDDFVVDADAFRDAGRTFVVDIAQPRDVPPDATAHDAVTVRDIEALESVTDENRRQRERAAAEVEDLIDVEFDHLQARYKRKRADKVISAMYESAERVKAQELETALGKLDGLDEDERAIVESMADAIVNQLLSAPTRSLRDAAEEDDWSTINTALQLFDPDFGPESIAPPDADSPDEPASSLDPADLPDAVREQMPDGMLEQISDD